MAMNFIGCDRDQVFLMPPSVREWVPEDHLVWTVLDVVYGMDLRAFYGDHRSDGDGRPAYEPSMMVALLIYAYARGNRSSRGVGRACIEDVACSTSATSSRWSSPRTREAVVSRGIEVLIPPDAALRKNTRPGWDGGLYAFMRRVLQTGQVKALYRKRKVTVEPVFGQMKFNRRFDRFQRRGRAACRSEWRLFGASHNLLKLHAHRADTAGA